jgi:hypothetical protein
LATSIQTISKIALLADIVGIAVLIVLIWQGLRQQMSDFGKVGSVTVLIALCFLLYFLGRAFITS